MGTHICNPSTLEAEAEDGECHRPGPSTKTLPERKLAGGQAVMDEEVPGLGLRVMDVCVCVCVPVFTPSCLNF